MIAFLTTIGHVPGWTSQVINTGWLVLAVALPFGLRRVAITPCHLLGLLFVLYAALSLTWSTDLISGLVKLAQILLIAGAFWYGSTLLRLTGVYIGLGLGVTVSAAIAIAQIFGFDGILQTSAPGGLFGNSGILAQTGVIILVPLILERLWWLIPGPVIAVILGGSRAAWLTLGFIALLRYRLYGAIIAAIAVAFALSLGRGSEVRFEIITEILRTATFFGHGLGTFAFDTSAGFVHHAHNDFLEFFSELGVATTLLLVIFALALDGKDQTAKLTLLAFAFVSLFAFPTFVPTTAFLAGVLAGKLSTEKYYGSLAIANRPLPQRSWYGMGT